MNNTESNSIIESIKYNDVLNEDNECLQINDNSLPLLSLKTFPFYYSNLSEEDESYSNKKIPELYFINRPENRELKEKISTDDKTPQKINIKKDIPQNKKSKKEWHMPVCYNNEKITKLFNELKTIEKFENFEDIIQIVEDKKEFLLKKRKRTLSISDKDFEEKYKQKLIEDQKKQEEKSKQKLGRKKENDNPGKHNKMSEDNIIKKIKSIIFKNIISFLNNILEPALVKKEDKLSKLSYQFIKASKKDEELEDLNSCLKVFASKEISSKYTTKKEEHNKNILEKIEKNENDPTISFSLNLTVKDWLDLFCFKKTINEILIEYKLNKDDIDIERIKNSLDNLNRVDRLLNKIKENNSSEYLKKFIFLLYNYELYFYIKNGRSEKVKSKRK